MTRPSNHRRIMITGYHGFTAKHLTTLLRAEKYQVYGIVQNHTTQPDEYQADITDLNQIRDALTHIEPDYIVHLAAISSVTHNNENDFYRVNLFGTLNILRAVKDLNLPIQKILIASSANVYGNNDSNHITEQACPLPINHYGNSKLAMENMVRTWFESLPIIMTRPFNYTGVGQSADFLIPKIVNHYRERKTSIQLGNIDVTRDFSDVRFVSNAYGALLKHNVHSEIFNVCSGHGYSLLDVIQMMNEIAGYEIKIEVNPDFIRKNEIRKLIGSNAKLIKTIGEVKSYPFRETLAELYHANL